MKSGQARCWRTSTAPLRPAGAGQPAHTTALLASRPLLLGEDVMGYSATLVPFSSFLRGFLGGGGGAGRQGMRRDTISHQCLGSPGSVLG